MKRFPFFLAPLIIAVMFSSCTKDEKKPTPQQIGEGKFLVRVVVEGKEPSDPWATSDTLWCFKSPYAEEWKSCSGDGAGRSGRLGNWHQGYYDEFGHQGRSYKHQVRLK